MASIALASAGACTGLVIRHASSIFSAVVVSPFAVSTTFFTFALSNSKAFAFASTCSFSASFASFVAK